MTDDANAKAWEILSGCCEYDGPGRVFENAREAIVTAIREARQQERAACAEIARMHGNFCDSEARNGGSDDLRERATGAWHIASRIEARAAGKEGE